MLRAKSKKPYGALGTVRLFVVAGASGVLPLFPCLP